METTRATRTTDKAVSTNRLQESEVETSLAKIIAAVMSEDDSIGSKLEGLDAEKGHFAAQKVSSRSSRIAHDFDLINTIIKDSPNKAISVDL